VPGKLTNLLPPLLLALLPAPALPAEASLAAETEAQCSYPVVAQYPHDRGAFTQGLLYSHGHLYESTGLFGQSTLREVDLESGRVLRKQRLPPEDFGEGLALVDEQLLQLTWTSDHGYRWDRASFTLNAKLPFHYASPHADGVHRPWGLCYDHKRLVLSNGTNILHFLDPRSFAAIGAAEIHDSQGPVHLLNELECIGDKVLANVWNSDTIVVIDPATGRVTARLELPHLYPLEQRKTPQDVLNGIAYDVQRKRLLVTGKRWPRLFELELSDQCLTP
jgi:glutamine cyclotransferase